MKKRIIFFISALLAVITLASCKNTRKTADYYEVVTTEYSEETRIAAVAKAEKSTVLVKYGVKSGLFSSSYTYVPGVIYKQESNKYYVVSIYNDNMRSLSTVDVHIDEDTTESNASLYGYDLYNEIAVFVFYSSESYTCAGISDETVSSGLECFSLASYSTTSTSEDYDYKYNNILVSGIVSRTDGRLAQHTCLNNSEEIGSPLFDYDGDLLGITVNKILTASGETINGFNFAIDSDALNIILPEIYEDKKVSRPSLSIAYEMRYRFDDADEQFYTLPDECESVMYVNRVNSDCSFSTLRAGDMIYTINGKIISSSYDALSVLYLLRKTDTVTLIVYRASSGGYTKLTITN